MEHRTRRPLTAVVAVVAVLLGTAVTAHAKPLANFVDEGSFAFVDTDCEGLELLVEGTFREHVLINGRGQDRVPHFRANVSFTEVYTNPETGKTFTISGRFVDQDHIVTDNGDGTYTVVIQLAGRIHSHGPDGKLLFIDSGMVRNETLWTDDGPFPSGGTFLGGDEIKNAGQSQTADRDFCEDMHELLG